MKILITGATGYIGGRLIPLLLQSGHEVHILVRDQKRIQNRLWSHQVTIHEGDLLKTETLSSLCEEMDVAYYLVHSMLAGKKFEDLDKQAAENFVKRAPKLKKVIYLGGLQPHRGDVSSHLRSRAEVGKILADHLPTIEFRAGPIIGSGSASFEVLRYLTERLPIMVAPKWIKNTIQPIAVRDVLSYLTQAIDLPFSETIDIGGDQLTFKEMMLRYAKVRGLKRWIIPVPVLAPRFAGRWVEFVTPIPNRIAVPIIEGVVETLVMTNQKAKKYFPHIHPISYEEAVTLALNKISLKGPETRWSNALGPASPAYILKDEEGMIQEVRRLECPVSSQKLFKTVCSLGGDRGWLFWNWAWRVRGILDRWFGGPGLRRGRRHPEEVLPGEAIDFWRVEELEAGKLLRLRAEMKVPGRAWLQFEVKDRQSSSVLIQTAFFAPKGFLGFVYWYLLYPFHRFIFSGMAEAIVDLAKKKNALI